MPRHRKWRPSLVSLVLLSFASVAAVPRAGVYAHRHAGGDHAHVHGSDGTRAGSSTATVDDLLADAHEHQHAHPHEHDGARVLPASGARDASATDATARQKHNARHDDRSPHLAAAGDGLTHVHWQATCVPAVPAAVARLERDETRRRAPEPRPVSAARGARLAPHARGPPVLPA